MAWYYHLSKDFSQFVVIHTVKGFGIVSKEEVDVFLDSFFFCDSTDVSTSVEFSLAHADVILWNLVK